MSVWMDVDTGIDDAIALILAARLYGPKLGLVTCVCGNADLAEVTENTRRILAFVGRTDVPVVAGSARPLVREPVAVRSVHGTSGLGRVTLPPSSRPPDPSGMTAVARAVQSLGSSGVELVATAPLTNVALLVRAFPQSLVGVERAVWMGGSFGPGNVTAAAEFNAYADPEAASIVLSALSPVTMVGLGVTSGLRITAFEARALAALSPAGKLVGDLLLDPAYSVTASEEGFPVHDAAALLEAFRPGALFSTCELGVTVDLSHGPSYGATLCGHEGPLTDVAIRPDRPAFLGWMRKALDDSRADAFGVV